ncbi:MAG: B12-binding domain-containing radical SAM protein, partial [Vicinamibacteria bacterium]
MKRNKVVLYNPRADFYTMPLALLSLGSALDRKRYEVRIIDARVQKRPIETVVHETRDALCLGITVLTGKPIADALRATRAVKAARPDCPVVWGGWHPSLFPKETLLGSGIDATVQGQGERTFAEILERLEEGSGLEGVEGCTHRTRNEVRSNAPRAAIDVNSFPALDYQLVSLERYFALKGQRQLDYITSQGCRFRCTFCADPTVYRRAWFGLEPDRVGSELEHLSRRHPFEDLAFQDETFFTQQKRVAAIAAELLRRDLRFRWMATL